jgi:Golgi apparatus protein 1
VCGYEKDSLDSIAGYDGRVLECLQDYKDELVTPACKKRVHKLTVRAAQDIRMDRPLSDACYDDRQKLCAGVQPGDARVLRCLQDSREQLTYECRATLFDQEVRLAEDIDFQFPLKKACAGEIPRFCKVGRTHDAHHTNSILTTQTCYRTSSMVVHALFNASFFTTKRQK